MRSILKNLTVVFLLALIGCATNEPITTQHFDSENVTTYRTGLLNTGIAPFGSTLGDSGHILYQVRARCEGTNCTPEEVVLCFFLDSGFNTIYLDDRSLTIEAGGERYEWERQRWLDIRNSPPVIGEIIAVNLDLEQLETIAQAERVTGSLASQPFEWSHNRRKALRMLLNKIKGLAEPEGR